MSSERQIVIISYGENIKLKKNVYLMISLKPLRRIKLIFVRLFVPKLKYTIIDSSLMQEPLQVTQIKERYGIWMGHLGVTKLDSIFYMS